MTSSQHRICRLAEEAAATSEPEAALEALRELRDELAGFERSRVAEALRSGSSFGTIAKAMGISRQAAHRRYRDLAPTSDEPISLSSHARRAVQLAGEEAAAAGAPGVASAHLLLGVLRSGGGVSRALEAEGVSHAAARRCLSADATPHGAEDGAGRAVLVDAAEIARARHSPCIEVDHIVLAALNGADGGALRAITALGVTPAAVRDRLGC